MGREEYIKCFTHMQDEDQKCMLGGMAWDDIYWHIHGAVDKDYAFTRNEFWAMKSLFQKVGYKQYFKRSH